MNLGQAIIKIRKERNISQENLAFEAGVSRHFMYKIENNLASPTVKTLEKLSAALATKPSAILSEAENITE